MERVGGELTAPQICDIIKACHTNGVVIFTFGALSVEFTKAQVIPDTKLEAHVPSSDKPEPVIPVYAPEQHEELLKLQKEEYIANLKIIDPLEYERKLAEGEIEDIQDGYDDRGAE